MYLSELFESDDTAGKQLDKQLDKQLLVIFPGRFQMPHRGHIYVYNYLYKKFKSANTYLVTSDKVDTSSSPFSFNEKKLLLTLAGIPDDKIIQAERPYTATELTSNFDRTKTILLIGVSVKDMSPDNPRFTFEPNKDGRPSYYQPFKSIEQCETFNKHGYIVIAPTVEFDVLNTPVSSASETRELFKNSNDKQRKQIMIDLYGKFNPHAYNLIKSKLN